MASDQYVRSTLRRVWHRTVGACEEIAGTSDSRWSVIIDEERYTVRIVPESRRLELVTSLAATEALAASGIVVGRPVRTVDGALTTPTSAGGMALVQAVAGRPLLATDPLDQQWWGDLLGRAHFALLGHQTSIAARLSMPDLTGTHLSVASWLRPAVEEVATAVTRLMVTDQLTYGVLHGDPGPDMFHLDVETGGTAMVGWGIPKVGPLVYDVAVAVRHAGGLDAADELVDGYVSSGPVTRDELSVALGVMLRLHWAHTAEDLARTLAGTGSIVPLPRAAASEMAARRDALEVARLALADLAEADRAE